MTFQDINHLPHNQKCTVASALAIFSNTRQRIKNEREIVQSTSVSQCKCAVHDNFAVSLKGLQSNWPTVTSHDGTRDRHSQGEKLEAINSDEIFIFARVKISPLCETLSPTDIIRSVQAILIKTKKLSSLCTHAAQIILPCHHNHSFLLMHMVFEEKVFDKMSQ